LHAYPTRRDRTRDRCHRSPHALCRNGNRVFARGRASASLECLIA
jgi:hypothetical protein